MKSQDLFPLNSFKGALHLEMFNLQDSSSPTLLAKSLRQYSAALVDRQACLFWTQRKVPSSIRVALARECGNEHFDIAHPAALPFGLRSRKWQVLVDTVDDARHLERAQQALLVRLLTSLGMPQCALNVFSSAASPDQAATEGDLQLANALARARFLVNKEKGSSYRAAYRPDDYWAIVNKQILGSPAACSATFSLMLQYITEEPDRATVRSLALLLQRQADSLDSVFARSLVRSMYHRGYALLPAGSRDLAEMTRHMDLADQYSGLAVEVSEGYDAFVALENRYSVLESRIKEKLLAEDSAAAAHYASLLLHLDPLDARALMSIAEAFAANDEFERAASCYCAAAQSGPIYTAAAWYMAGQCYAVLNEPEQATVCFLTSLRLDPDAISAAHALAQVDTCGSPVSRWAEVRQAALAQGAT